MGPLTAEFRAMCAELFSLKSQMAGLQKLLADTDERLNTTLDWDPDIWSLNRKMVKYLILNGSTLAPYEHTTGARLCFALEKALMIRTLNAQNRRSALRRSRKAHDNTVPG
ncbi:hypothetical protein NDU88_002232 [Pleurodeles waltl]|uniref:Uncharacterized protein n=1 Tax=Pleurodeles waltl TaxID=8319 RepID=A0AAV7UX07_PLEWA|nr:hypothetical protein NDU88_002232 [Pleurodeles waltl]